jgi:hypothetical protein
VRELLTAFACFLLGASTSVVILLHYYPEPPAAVPVQCAVVRMLDVTIRDSNTTNRRQRFICTPEKGSK